MGVFKRPEDIGVQVEYLNPSFLVKEGIRRLSPCYSIFRGRALFETAAVVDA